MTKYIRFALSKDAEPTTAHGLYGVLDGDKVIETGRLFSRDFAEDHRLEQVKLLPPVMPSKIVCVGRNYVDHAKELGNDVPVEPLIFLKPPSSLITSGDAIVYPPQSARVDFEGEIGVVIGKRGRHIGADEAMGYIFGYTCVNDVTARDLQKKDGQWTRGKGFDTFCAVGPWMVAKEEFDLGRATLRTRLNGEVKQEGKPEQMIFNLGAILAFVSSFLTLEPGDLIATGTPAGVGPMQPGDQVSVEIEGLGTLTNTVIKG
ncbi:MAG: fumarylacetoacetate hydrolase family protein [Bryobacter sp.]|jgi:2-keto-4-pentenoate hydratase/2-oxohepta-3-ene-1,7-dioic acid hydratase in catechol pathway|nr:fumarylacetoacetate hydrolase family protein [Bryobacter sp. CoA8 C33]